MSHLALGSVTFKKEMSWPNSGAVELSNWLEMSRVTPPVDGTSVPLLLAESHLGEEGDRAARRGALKREGGDQKEGGEEEEGGDEMWSGRRGRRMQKATSLSFSIELRDLHVEEALGVDSLCCTSPSPCAASPSAATTSSMRTTKRSARTRLRATSSRLGLKVDGTAAEAMKSLEDNHNKVTEIGLVNALRDLHTAYLVPGTLMAEHVSRLRNLWQVANDMGAKIDDPGFRTIFISLLGEEWDNVVPVLYTFKTSSEVISFVTMHAERLNHVPSSSISNPAQAQGLGDVIILRRMNSTTGWEVDLILMLIWKTCIVHFNRSALYTGCSLSV
ncbi:hypothetical protein B0H14DRAFT_3717052 [Mycena olivaceomarginata]|nr:hypothetical protein B0H14DRAFT_3717052 [Mycena olivaceomarginata]